MNNAIKCQNRLVIMDVFTKSIGNKINPNYIYKSQVLKLEGYSYIPAKMHEGMRTVFTDMWLPTCVFVHVILKSYIFMKIKKHT